MKYRLLALLTALTLILAPAARASDALGWELERTVTRLGEGVTFTDQTLWGDSRSDYRRERYLVYTPNPHVRPAVAYGGTVPSVASLTRLAQDLEGYGGRVLGGTNGDYFSMSTGTPLGMVVTWGVLRSSSSYHYAVGFRSDGTAFVGKPDLGVWAEVGGYRLSVSGGYNKDRGTDGPFVLLNGDYGYSTGAYRAGVDVILRPVTVEEEYEPMELDPIYVVDEETGEPVIDESTRTPLLDPETGEPILDPESFGPLLDPETGEPILDPETGEPVPDPDSGTPLMDPDSGEPLVDWEAMSAILDAHLARWAEAQPSVAAALTVNGALRCVVEEVVEAEGPTVIPAGRFVLSLDGAKGSQFHREQLLKLRVGEEVDLSVTSEDPRWEEAVTAIGAYALLLEHGELAEGLDQAANPRTALGLRENGEVVLYTVDGRQPGYSVGASTTMVARRLLELGCVEAVLFDGGGSTTFGTTGALEDSFAVNSSPSEGYQRQVSNALFFVSDLAPTGEPGSLYIAPHSALMLSGARLDLLSYVIDTGGYPMNTVAEEVTYTAAGPGEVEGAVLMAGETRGEVTVTAQGAEGVTGEAVFTVVDTPHDIALYNELSGKRVTALNLSPGSEVRLSAVASWYKISLLSDDSCFTWSCDEAVGEIDGSGTFTAGAKGAAGDITVTAGRKTVTLPVSVAGHVTLREDFEALQLPSAQGPDDPDDPDLPEAPEETALSLTLTPDGTKFARGRRSLRGDYPLEGASAAPLSIPLTAGEDTPDSWLGLWLWGDGSAAALSLSLRLADGGTEEVLLTEGGFTGWEQVMVPIPEEAVEVTGLTVIPAEDSTGTLWLDHLVTANLDLCDTEPPAVTLKWEEGVATAVISDDVDKTFPFDQVSLTLDGQPIPFTLSGSTLTAPVLTPWIGMGRLSVTVTDASGNMGRDSVWLEGMVEAETPFEDTADHWAEPYAIYLYQHAVTKGSGADGLLYYFPGSDITRGEFATMLCRWLGADTGEYRELILPFTDVEEIPIWALPAIQTLHGMGIFNGSLDGDGLYAHPNAPITRAEAMTMLGRMQPGGFAPQREEFADHGEIPDWAAPHVYSLAGQGAVSGYLGLVRPNDPITRGEVAKLLAALW